MDQLQWEAEEHGFRSGRYSLVLEAPGRWALRVGRRHHSTHRGATRAAIVAGELERSHRRNRRFLAYGAVLAVVVVVLALAVPRRTRVNPDHAPAAAFAAPMEAAYLAISAGEAAPEDYTTADDGFAGGRISVSLASLGEGSEDVERSYLVLAGEYPAGECTGAFVNQYRYCPCYVLRWQEGRGAFTGVLAPTLPCDPTQPALAGTWSYDRFAPVPPRAPAVNWEGVLPPAQLQASWFLPLLIGAFLVCAQALIGVTMTLYRYRGVTIGSEGIDPALVRPVRDAAQ